MRGGGGVSVDFKQARKIEMVSRLVPSLGTKPEKWQLKAQGRLEKI